jgi:hypothetical protein
MASSGKVYSRSYSTVAWSAVMEVSFEEQAASMQTSKKIKTDLISKLNIVSL